MTDKARTARERLGGQDLIGFVRSESDGQQMVQRASSAKVFNEPASVSNPGKVSPVAPPRQARKSQARKSQARKSQARKSDA